MCVCVCGLVGVRVCIYVWRERENIRAITEGGRGETMNTEQKLGLKSKILHMVINNHCSLGGGTTFFVYTVHLERIKRLN